MMKRLLITLVLAISSIVLLYSQEREGKFFAGGSLGFNFRNSNAEKDVPNGSTSKTTSFSSAVTAGYNISNKFSAGLDIEWNISNTNYENGPLKYYHNYDYLVAPFFRYYMKSNFFAQGQINVGFSKSENKFDFFDEVIGSYPVVSKQSYNTLGYGLGLGYDIKVKENIFIEPMVKFISNKLNDKETSNLDVKQNDIFFNVGLIVNL